MMSQSGNANDVGIMWIGAVSFEERCYASLKLLIDSGAKLSEALLVDYPTVTSPVTEAEEKRSRHRAKILSLLSEACVAPHQFTMIQPYSFMSLIDALGEVIKRGRPRIVLDVSCLTKIHAMAAAAALGMLPPSTTIAYTVPDNYNFGGAAGATRWGDIILGPLSEKPAAFTEEGSRGIVIAGHENERLEVAFGEVEPTGGIIIFTETEGRPDFRHVAEARNRKSVRRLLRSGKWERFVVSSNNPAALAPLIDLQVREAGNAPVVVYPFGPKTIIFEAARRLITSRPESGWFVYPVPTHYQANYSFGLGSTAWFSLRENGHMRRSTVPV